MTASPDSLWPPNGKLRLVSLSGATDPDGDAITIAITGVTQDEPVNGNGDANRAPDAVSGPTPSQVQLRAERAGGGTGASTRSRSPSPTRTARPATAPPPSGYRIVGPAR